MLKFYYLFFTLVFNYAIFFYIVYFGVSGCFLLVRALELFSFYKNCVVAEIGEKIKVSIYSGDMNIKRLMLFSRRSCMMTRISYSHDGSHPTYGATYRM